MIMIKNDDDDNDNDKKLNGELGLSSSAPKSKETRNKIFDMCT